MKNSKLELLRATGLALAAFGIYAMLLSKGYVFEGLIRAMPIETGAWGYLFPGNYLLYGPLGLVFHTVLHTLGAHPLAVTSLQLMDTVLGAAGLFSFYFLLRRLGGEPWESAVWSVILGTCQGYWLWSTEAEDYILSTVLLLLLFYALVRSRDRETDPLLLGALHGLAVLGHIVNVVFAPVVLWFLYQCYGRRVWKPAGRYAAGVAVVAGAAYGAVIIFLRKPANFHEVWNWFLGSAGTTGGFTTGTGYTLENLRLWAMTTLRLFVPLSPSHYRSPAAWPGAEVFVVVAGLVLAIFFGVLVIQLRQLYRRYPAVVGACGLWLLMYALVFVRWQPFTLVYRVSDLVPLCTLLFLAYREFKQFRPVLRGIAIALAVSLTIGNGMAEILPRSFASNNSHLSRMVFLKANTQEGDWITGDSGQDEIYIPYFAQRKPIVMGRYAENPSELERVIDALSAHRQAVFVTSRVLEDPLWKMFFQQYRMTLIARDGTEDLYRLGKKGA